MKKILLIIVGFFLFSTGFAQIMGSVFDQNGNNVSSATIKVKRITRGTMSGVKVPGLNNKKVRWGIMTRNPDRRNEIGDIPEPGYKVLTLDLK